ncbi:MAG: GyrI-like domain-containing protein [Anaerolineales bacterium]|nr:GyrI-like domain-containing protein [Anaerolineales bacterium]
MNKFDCKKDLKHLYQPSSKEFSLINVPSMNYLLVDGHGDPNTSLQYQKSVEALYSIAYKIKFILKPQGIDFTVSPLEGLWWVDDMTKFSVKNKGEWDWTMMIMQPKWVEVDVFEKAREIVAKQKVIPELSKMRFESFEEGLAVQILYWGAYADESPTIARMHEFIHSSGLFTNGKHHEIYLGDPRKTAPEKLKTILRQPVRKAHE